MGAVLRCDFFFVLASRHYLHLHLSVTDPFILLKMFTNIKKLLVVLFMVAPLFLLAQPGPPAGGSPPCGAPFGPSCPIDGGISLLIAAGLAFGGKKAYDVSRKDA
jgi:hypothetical protein